MREALDQYCQTRPADPLSARLRNQPPPQHNATASTSTSATNTTPTDGTQGKSGVGKGLLTGSTSTTGLATIAQSDSAGSIDRNGPNGTKSGTAANKGSRIGSQIRSISSNALQTIAPRTSQTSMKISPANSKGAIESAVPAVTPSTSTTSMKENNNNSKSASASSSKSKIDYVRKRENTQS